MTTHGSPRRPDSRRRHHRRRNRRHVPRVGRGRLGDTDQLALGSRAWFPPRAHRRPSGVTPGRSPPRALVACHDQIGTSSSGQTAELLGIRDDPDADDLAVKDVQNQGGDHPPGMDEHHGRLPVQGGFPGRPLDLLGHIEKESRAAARADHGAHGRPHPAAPIGPDHDVVGQHAQQSLEVTRPARHHELPGEFPAVVAGPHRSAGDDPRFAGRAREAS